MKKSAKDEVHAAATLPGPGVLHTQAAIRKLLGHKGHYHALLRAFRDQYASAPVQVAATIASGDVVGGLRLLHALRGTAAMIGGLELAEVAGAAEVLLQRAKPPDHKALLDGLTAALQATLLAIEQQLGGNDSPESSSNHGKAG